MWSSAYPTSIVLSGNNTQGWGHSPKQNRTLAHRQAGSSQNLESGPVPPLLRTVTWLLPPLKVKRGPINSSSSLTTLSPLDRGLELLFPRRGGSTPSSPPSLQTLPQPVIKRANPCPGPTQLPLSYFCIALIMDINYKRHCSL